MSASVGRNDPCPCGSGRKYKNCHEGKVSLDVKGRRAWVLAALGLVVAALAWGLVSARTRPATQRTRMGTPTATTTTGAAPNAAAPNAAPFGTGAPAPMSGPAGAPQAWAYDATTNRHYDPNHGHWHPGPPPAAGARGAAAAPQAPLGASPASRPLGTTPPGAVPAPGTMSAAPSPTPAPWTYDPKKNQHWDPSHNHWHPGPPPAGAR